MGLAANAVCNIIIRVSRPATGLFLDLFVTAFQRSDRSCTMIAAESSRAQ